jgi:hypothetical protein
LNTPGLARVLVLLTVATVVGCAEPLPDAERIEARIRAMSEALTEGDTSDFMAPLAEDFTATGRDLDRRAVRFLLRRELLAHERIGVRLFDIDVELRGDDRATARLHAVVSGGTGLIPDTGDWYRLETGWRLDDDEWMLISARWDSVAGRD